MVCSRWRLLRPCPCWDQSSSTRISHVRHGPTACTPAWVMHAEVWPRSEQGARKRAGHLLGVEQQMLSMLHLTSANLLRILRHH